MKKDDDGSKLDHLPSGSMTIVPRKMSILGGNTPERDGGEELEAPCRMRMLGSAEAGYVRLTFECQLFIPG